MMSAYMTFVSWAFPRFAYNFTILTYFLGRPATDKISKNIQIPLIHNMIMKQKTQGVTIIHLSTLISFVISKIKKLIRKDECHIWELVQKSNERPNGLISDTWVSSAILQFLILHENYTKQNRSTEGCSKLKRSVDMTSSEKNGLNIKTYASFKWDRTRCPEE